MNDDPETFFSFVDREIGQLKLSSGLDNYSIYQRDNDTRYCGEYGIQLITQRIVDRDLREVYKMLSEWMAKVPSHAYWGQKLGIRVDCDSQSLDIIKEVMEEVLYTRGMPEELDNYVRRIRGREANFGDWRDFISIATLIGPLYEWGKDPWDD